MISIGSTFSCTIISIFDFCPPPFSQEYWIDQPVAYCPARLPVPLLLILTSRESLSLLCRFSILPSPCLLVHPLFFHSPSPHHLLLLYLYYPWHFCYLLVLASSFAPFLGFVLIIPLSYLSSLISTSSAISSTFSRFLLILEANAMDSTVV